MTALISPLDWGTGHTTRCIPIIKSLLALNVSVTVACNLQQQRILETEIKGLDFLYLRGYGVSYSKRKWMLPFVLLYQLPKIAFTIWFEHRWLAKQCLEIKPDLVVSDNRFGFCNKKHRCVFITHQLTIKAPYVWAERIIQRINYGYIQHYDACWVPDCAGDVNVAGLLSHPALMPNIPAHYLGLLTRFSTNKGSFPSTTYEYKYACILSGPEPQRTILEEILLKGLSGQREKTVMVRGTEKPSTLSFNQNENLFIHDRLLGNDLLDIMIKSEYIICRGGYTTVMEIFALDKRAIFIPTPGQTEQEYLCERLMGLGYAYYMPQEGLDLEKLISGANLFTYKKQSFSFFTGADMEGLLKNVFQNHP